MLTEPDDLGANEIGADEMGVDAELAGPEETGLLETGAELGYENEIGPELRGVDDTGRLD